MDTLIIQQLGNLRYSTETPGSTRLILQEMLAMCVCVWGDPNKVSEKSSNYPKAVTRHHLWNALGYHPWQYIDQNNNSTRNSTTTVPGWPEEWNASWVLPGRVINMGHGITVSHHSSPSGLFELLITIADYCLYGAGFVYSRFGKSGKEHVYITARDAVCRLSMNRFKNGMRYTAKKQCKHVSNQWIHTHW